MKKIITALAIFTLLSGCVTKDLSDADRQQIKTVWIKPLVYSEEQFKYHSMDQAWAAGLNAGVGAASGMSSGAKVSAASLAGASAASRAPVNEPMSPRAAILLNMQRNEVDPGEMFSKAFAARVEKETSFKVVPDGGGADVTVELLGTEWGLSLVNFSKELYPVLSVVAIMKRRDVDVWRNFELITALSDGNDVGFTPERYATDPEALRAAYGHAVQLLVDKLMVDLKQ